MTIEVLAKQLKSVINRHPFRLEHCPGDIGYLIVHVFYYDETVGQHPSRDLRNAILRYECEHGPFVIDGVEKSLLPMCVDSEQSARHYPEITPP
jgi:hypothetical protein